MLRSSLFFLLFAGLLAGCAPADSPAPEGESDAATPAIKSSIVDLAVDTPSVSTLVSALQAADLVSTLQGDGPFTVFAPVNQAFAGLAEGELDRLLEPGNVDELRDVLTYHVVAGALDANEVASQTSITALNGKDLQVSVRGETVLINDAAVGTANIVASNGIIHLIDGVLMEW